MDRVNGAVWCCVYIRVVYIPAVEEGRQRPAVAVEGSQNLAAWEDTQAARRGRGGKERSMTRG